MVYQDSHRAPLRHLEFVPECGTQRTHQVRRKIRRRKLMTEIGGGTVGRDRPWKLLWRMGPSKHELKVCYWTEGVPSVKETGFGPRAAAASVAAAS